MQKRAVIVRLSRNIFVAILSTGWIIPIWAGIHKLLLWMYHAHQPDYHKEIDSGFHIQFSNGLINIGLLWLGIILIFWVFVLTNKFWPIKGEKDK